MHRNAKRLAALAAALLFALSGCGRTELTEPGPSPSAPPAPAEQPQESPQTEELERLSLPEGYAPLEAPQTGGLSERDVRRFEYEDLAAPGRPAFDLSALPDRLWPQGGYETGRQGEGEVYALARDGGRELFYHDDRYALFERYEAERPALTSGIEELRQRAQAELERLLGSKAFFEHPQPADETFYLRNGLERPENAEIFSWNQTVDGIPVDGHALNAIAGEGGLLGFAMRWGVLEPRETPMPQKLLSAEEALYSLNCARSRLDASAAMARLSRIIHVELVYTTQFAERPTLLRPAWRFALADEALAEGDTVLVDAATGDLYSDHDGWMDSAFPALASRSVEMANGGIAMEEAAALLKQYVETAWSSLHSLSVPELPDFAMETVENIFHCKWAAYRIERIRNAPGEQAKAPPKVSVSVRNSSVDGIEVRVTYDAVIRVEREQGTEEISRTDNAAFVFRNGRWMLRRIGLVWDGTDYEDTFYALRKDGSLSVVDDAVRSRIEGLEAVS